MKNSFRSNIHLNFFYFRSSVLCPLGLRSVYTGFRFIQGLVEDRIHCICMYSRYHWWAFFLIFQIIVVACLRIYTKLFFVLWFILDFFCSQTFWSCYYSLSSDPCKHTLFLENDKIMTLTKITSITYEVKLVLE